ncbi:nucleoside triphosphate pyrophosphohydrolase [Halanaerobacter jeridensis]|uniref:Tetrapyrrole methylase family protein/MazG family protein n=1 Tax=Halanaerobacter jeridensis TaxID=706427 RepID=A0A938XVT4_9FIRM|nr:nucleoside triphosphate pyrophosphohydrolase [Halanaerobacter jeridensis]MBM7557201.1 tetrapyrrole methylase family protein/MazG family protein [Halanaerobacter jeridensis]
MLKIVGLGAGDLDLLTLRAYRTLKEAENLYLRTAHHPAVDDLKAEGVNFESFDELYESKEQFAAIYEEIASNVIDLMSEQDLVYAVPGHPLVAEDSVQQIIARLEDDEYEIIAGPSFLDAIFAKLNLDPIEGVKVLDGLNFRSRDLEPGVATIISQVYNKSVASEIKLELMKVYRDEFNIKVLRGIGVADEEIIEEVPLYKLDRLDYLDHLTTVYIPADESNPTQLNKLVEIMEILRSDQGCPWDQKQDYDSLKKHLIEESYEVVERIESDDYFGLAEELGDLLLQVVFLAQIGSEEGHFDIYEVITQIVEKMIRRHPHVFGEEEVETAKEVMENWRQIKDREKSEQSHKSILTEVPSEFPALLQAQKVQAKAAEVGFDWPEIEGAVAKIEEELEELKVEIETGQSQAAQEELGDLLFAVVNAARFLEVDAETNLRETINKFKQRFKYITDQAQEIEKALDKISLEQMEQWWREAKELQEGEDKNA